MLLHGVTISSIQLRSIGKNLYNDAAATLTSPSFTVKINPGTLAPKSKSSVEMRRNFSWVVTKEYDVASPSEGQPARQSAQVVLLVQAGRDVTDTQLGDLIDFSATVPDAGRLIPIILGAS